MSAIGQLYSFLIVCFYLTSGCLSPAPVAPPSFRQRINTQLTYNELQEDPERYIGERVLFGGIIIEIQNYPLKTELEILEKPLDQRDIPIKTGYSSGRFLAVYEGYLDRLVYAPGRLMTIAGIVTGQRIKDKYGIKKEYPVMKVEFFQLWPSQEPYYYPYWFQSGSREEKTPPFWDR